jgi:predicted aconitase
MKMLAERAGYLAPLEQFGGTITVDTCILTSPMLSTQTRSIMTNSAKYAYYAPGLLNTSVVYGSLVDCVRSAEAGRIIRDDALWRSD